MDAKRLAVLLLIAVLASSIALKDRKFVDEQGREIRIHGPNVVVKVPPYHPRVDQYDSEFSFTIEDIANCTRWGFNGIRLGMMWSGVEPQKDTYNETYLDIMENLINLAGKNGIYTLIDYHQDIMGEKFCGDGIPTWLADELELYKTFPFPMGKKINLNASGLPSWQDCDTQGWGKYYFSYDVGHAFNQLYKIGTKLNTKFTLFWKKVASRFRNNPFVLGYELINEPFVGNAIRNLGLVIPSVAQRLKFQSFYDNLAHQIRAVDPKAVIFFEPITFDNTVPAGFSHPPGGRRYANQSVFSYHYYKPPALGLATIPKRIADGNRLGVMSFLSQYGTSDFQVLDLAQKNKQSWLYWELKSFGKNWGSMHARSESAMNLKENGINANRTLTYMQATAGELIDEQFNWQTKHYVAHYTANPMGKSILYFCEQLNYPGGHYLEFSPSREVSYRQLAHNYYEITFIGSAPKVVQVSMSAL